MDSLKSLPKDYAIMFGIKILLALLGVFTLGGILVFTVVTILYLNHAAMLTIVLSAWGTWLLYLSIFAIVYFLKKDQVNQKTAIIKSLANQKVLASLGLFTIKNLLKKFHKPHKKPIKLDTEIE